MDILSFLLTLAASMVFGTIGNKLKLPAGAMIGAILGAVIVNLFLGGAVFYDQIKTVLQLLSGAMIGSKIGMSDVRAMKKIIFPTLFLLLGMVVLNLTFGGAIFALSSLNVATSLFATAPGGMADMAIISSELGADPAYVGILQLLRILIILLCLPPIFKKILSGKEIAPPAKPVEANGQHAAPTGMVYARRFALLLAVCSAGGLLCAALGLAAGALTGSMIAGTLLCVFRGRLQFPSKLRFFMQVFSGAFIGVGIDRATIAALPELIVPALIMLAGIFVFVFGTSFLMYKFFKIDLAVCLLSCTPGGIQEMALLSEDLGADTPKVAVMQTMRLMCVILFFPTMLKFITLLFQ